MSIEKSMFVDINYIFLLQSQIAVISIIFCFDVFINLRIYELFDLCCACGLFNSFIFDRPGYV